MEGDNEIRCNLEGPLFLTALLMPHLLSRQNAAVINISSGLGFVPIARMPVYCATKAALHSFSVSLRHQLCGQRHQGLRGHTAHRGHRARQGSTGTRGQTDRGIPAQDVADAVMKGLTEDRFEIPVGTAADLVAGSRPISTRSSRI